MAISSSALLALALQCSPSLHLPTLSISAYSDITTSSCAFNSAGIALPHAPQGLTDPVMTTKKRMAKGATFSNAIGPRKTTQLAAANSDLDEIIPGFTGDGSAQSARLPQQTSPPPSYESWDVLRQYPRAAPLAPPAQSSVAAPKPQDTSKTVKESKDAQGKTATE